MNAVSNTASNVAASSVSATNVSVSNVIPRSSSVMDFNDGWSNPPLKMGSNPPNPTSGISSTNGYDYSVAGGASIWDVLQKLAKLKQEATDKADAIAQSMSPDDDEETKAMKQRELAKATAFIEDIQKKIEKLQETAHTTSNSRL